MSKSRKRSRGVIQPSEGAVRFVPRPRVEIDATLFWRVLWTQPLVEERVAAALARAGLASYTPMQAVEVFQRGVKKTLRRPAIGRYVFVGLSNLGTDFGRLRASLGQETPSAVEDVFSYVNRRGRLVVVEVRQPEPPEPLARLLRVDDVPLRVPAEKLQELEDRLSLHEAADGPGPAFRPGEAVRVTSGPWSGFVAEVEAATDGRVRALLDLFGRQTPVEFVVDDLEAAA